MVPPYNRNSNEIRKKKQTGQNLASISKFVYHKNMFKSHYLKLIIFFTSYNWFVAFVGTVLPPHLIDQGLTMRQIMWGILFNYLALFSLVLLKVCTHMKSRLSWQLAILLSAVYFLALIKIFSPFQLYAAYFVYGSSVLLFYLFYNVAHFEHTPKEKHGHSSAIMFSVGPIVSVVAPLLAGSLAQINYLIVWILAGIFLLITLYLANIQKSYTIKYSLRLAIEEITSTRTYTFIQGIWDAMRFGIIPIYGLFFIHTPLGYGTYIAYLSLSSAAANLLFGKFTDRKQKRMTYLYPVTIIMAGVTLLFPFVTSNVIYWIFLAGILQFFIPIFNNLMLTAIVDKHSDLQLAMAGREIFLNAGRVSGMIMVITSFYLEKSPFYIFIILGSILLLLPLNLFWKTRLTRKYSYL